MLSSDRSMMRAVELCFVDSHGKRNESWVLLLCVVAAQILRGKSSTVLSHLSTKQLGSWNTRGFVRATITHAMALVLLSPVDFFYNYVLRRLKLLWSKRLNDVLLHRFIRPNNPNEPNPDQHIASDVDKLVDLFLDLFLETFQAGVHLYFYTRILNKLSTSLSRTTVAASIVGTLGVGFIGRKLPRLYSEEIESFNDYRYALTRTREYSESILFYGGQDEEISKLQNRHRVKQEKTFIRKSKRDFVGVTSKLYRQLAAAIPFMMLHREINPAIELHLTHGHSHSHHTPTSSSSMSKVLQASGSFNEVLFHLMIIAENLNDFSRLQTLSTEVGLLLKIETPTSPVIRMDIIYESDNAWLSLQNPPSPVVGMDIIYGNDNAWLSLQSLTVLCKGRSLVQDLSLEMFRGDSILITGDSGIGKTTMLRAILGIWETGTGTVSRHSDIFFIPQKPYMTLGSLRNQLIYPLESKNLDNETLRNALVRVGLESLTDALEKVCDWSNELSLGEQQKIGFARLIISKPEFCILDEATSSCDVDSENSMYNIVKDTCLSWISVGHRQSITKFHSSQLRLLREGKWTIGNLNL